MKLSTAGEKTLDKLNYQNLQLIMMKRIIPNYTIKLLFLCLFLAAVSNSSAQILWDGGGDGTSWQDAANWMPDMVPPADSLVAFEQDAVVTGTAVVAVPRINIRGGATVTLDLDLTIGNGSTKEHAVVIEALSTLNMGTDSSRTFTINPASSKQGIAIFASADTASLYIAKSAVVQVQQGSNGINIVNTSSKVIIDGMVNFTSAVKNGIKNKGTFTNNGTLVLNELTSDGIQERGGQFENGPNGVITITKAGEDCIEIIDGGRFTNWGAIKLIAKDSAGTANNALAISDGENSADFINAKGGVLDANGGIKVAGRAISVNEMGSFTNEGQVILSGGNVGSRLYNTGVSINDLNGLMDLTDGRINNKSGVFTNNGLLKTAFTGAGVLTAGTSVNNAFFSYANSNIFSGGMGTITDSGINLNDSTQINIDAATACLVDVAESPYEWFEDTISIATADTTGSFTFPANSLSADSVRLSTSIDGVMITVHNICLEAVLTSSIFNRSEPVEQLKIYPSLVSHQHELILDLSTFESGKAMTFELLDMNGKSLQVIQAYGGQQQVIHIEDLQTGMYLIRGYTQVKSIGRFVVAK